MGIFSILSILFSLIFSLIATPLIRNLALKVRAAKLVKADLQQKQDIPRLGGISLFLPFFILALFIFFRYGNPYPELPGIVIGSIIIIFLGLLDDFVELLPAQKIFGQTLAIIVLIGFGVITSIVAIGRVGNILVTFFWMLAIINVFNLLDIMDGLCCGITIIAAATFLVISILSQNVLSAVFCSSLIGAGLGFLRYNLPPAKIYLGDTGSMFCGFILAAIAIVIDYAPLDRKIALITPILVLGLPLFDTAFVILMRLFHGRPVVRKSKDHFALRLLAAGWSKRKALLIMYIFSLFFAASALVISRVSNRYGIAILIIIVLICATALRKAGAVKIER